MPIVTRLSVLSSTADNDMTESGATDRATAAAIAMTSTTLNAEPIERVAFFEEQRRHRRASGRLAIVAALAVVLMGIPVSLVLTPLFYGALLVCGELVNLFHLLPISIGRSIAGAAHGFLDGTVSMPARVVLAGAMLAPGIVAIIALWLGVRAVLGRSGVGALLLTLGARTPAPADLEERQIQNLVEEMAVAAGLPPPRVMLLDGDAANAAVIGSNDANATLIVSRRLLDDFSREETQAIVGHLVGSISNGDLQIAFALASALQTFGLLIALLDAPFGRRSGQQLRRLIRLVLRRTGEDAEADLIGGLLAARLSLQAGDEATSEPAHPGLWVPFIVANQAVKWTLFIFTTALVGPMLALLWRARRYLADATAVQLTRNPEALWSALATLIQRGGMVEGSDQASYLFIVGPETVGWTHPGAKAPPKVDDKMGTNSLMTFHPAINRRLRRLEAQGATSRAIDAHSDRTPIQQMAFVVGTAFVWSLFGVGVIAAFAGMVLVVGVSVFIDVVVLTVIHGIFSLFA